MGSRSFFSAESKFFPLRELNWKRFQSRLAHVTLVCLFSSKPGAHCQNYISLEQRRLDSESEAGKALQSPIQIKI